MRFLSAGLYLVVMDTYLLLPALVVLWLLQGRGTRGQDTCDTCDCKLSSNDDERAIYSVRTRCTTGSIEWNGAYGAIRLEVRPYANHDYRFCFVVDSQHTVTQVSQETPQTRKANYRLQQEEEWSLRMSSVVVAARGKSQEHCIVGRTSSTGSAEPVLLYVEVERTTEFTGIPVVTVQYVVEKVTDSSLLYDPMEECRACTDEEVLEAYCTSDFVAVGSMLGAQHEEEGDHTNIQVAVVQLIHQSAQLDLFTRVRRSDRHLTGTIHAPRKCGVKAGKGDFLFTGRLRLGKPVLRCAPYFDQWQKISAMAECVYK